MNARGTAALLLAGLALSCAGGDGRPAASPASAAAPPAAAALPLAAEPPGFDFGRVLPGRSLEKTFSLRNLGREDLVLDSITTDCGCMIVGEHPNRLAPGASHPLRVLLQTPPVPGPLVRTVAVRTGGARPTTLQIHLRATIVKDGG